MSFDPVLKNEYNGGVQAVVSRDQPAVAGEKDDLALGDTAEFSVSFLSRNSSIAMIGGLVSQGIRFLVIVYVARRFSVSEFGLLSFAIAVSAYQFVICHFGLPFFGSRAVAKAGRVSHGLLAEVFCVKACLALGGMALSTGVLALVPGVSRKELLLVALFGLSNLPLAGFLDWAFQGLHRQEVSAILNVILQGSWLMLTVAGIRFGMGVSAVPAALAAAALIASTIGYFWLKQTGHIGRFNGDQPSVLRRSWQTLESAAPLGWGILLNTVLVWSDAIAVRLLRGEQAVGWYAAGNRAGLALATLASYYVQGAFPMLSRASYDSPAQFRKFFQHSYEDMAIAFVPGSLWAIFYAREIVLLLFKNPQYLAAVPVFQVFQAIFLLTALGNLYGLGALVAVHRDRDYRKVLALTASVFIPLCIALTAFKGILGASVAVLSTQVMSLILFARKSRQLVRARHGQALALPFGVGLGVVMAGKFLTLTLIASAVLLGSAYAGLIAARFRRDHLREGHC